MIASQMKSKRSSGAALKIESVADPEVNGNNNPVPFSGQNRFSPHLEFQAHQQCPHQGGYNSSR